MKERLQRALQAAYERKYLSPEEVDLQYGLNRGSLANDRSRRRGIPYRKVGRRILYRRDDVERFLESVKVETIDSIRRG